MLTIYVGSEWAEKRRIQLKELVGNCVNSKYAEQLAIEKFWTSGFFWVKTLLECFELTLANKVVLKIVRGQENVSMQWNFALFLLSTVWRTIQGVRAIADQPSRKKC